LCAEQGLGDTLQFLRFVPAVAARAREVVLQVQRELVELAGELPANCRVLPLDAPAPATDWQCSLLSVPAALRTVLADLAPPARLSVDAGKARHWRERLDTVPGRKVGLVWSGNPVHKNDRHRSIPLAAFRQLACDGVHFVSLQPEVRERDRATLAQWPALQHFGGDLGSFADTAALLQSLDLVVTVDTSVAHLAASLGRPTWILLPFNPDWRWLQEREDTPWYPGARLFRQQRPGDWDSVLQRVRGALDAPA
jgi:hypothetical protein